MRLIKYALFGLALAFGCLMSASANAAPTKVPTSFNPQKHVYQTGTKVNDKELEPRIVSETLNGQAVYVVFTVQGDEPFTNDLARDMTAKLLQTWQVQQGFPADNHLIVVVVQNKLHPQTWQAWATVGRKYAKLGVTSGDLLSAVNNNKNTLSTDPAGFAVATVHEVNARINALTGGGTGNNGGGNSGGSGSNGGSNHGTGMSGTTVLIIGVSVVGVIALVVVVVVIVRKKQKEAARKDAEEKLAGIQKLKHEVTTCKVPLTAAGLTFAPFQSRLDAADKLTEDARGNLEKDPEKARNQVTDAERQLQSLIADLKRAVELKNDKVLDGEINAADDSIKQTRSRDVVWNFPGISTQPRQNFLLNEEGCNPDKPLATARQERDSIVPALMAGNISQAENHWNAGRRACAEVGTCINRTMSAKERVERDVSSVLRDTENADKPLVEGVKRAYLAQQFISANTQLASLERLIADRREARKVVNSCVSQRDAVQEELRSNDQYVSYDVNTKFDRAKGELQALTQEVTSASADWAAVRARAEAVQSTFRQVRQDIVDARQAYEAARESVRQLHREFGNARFPDPRFTTMTEPSRAQLGNLVAELERLNHEVSGSKKDWNGLKGQVNEAIRTVQNLRLLIEEDNAKWQLMAAGEQQLSTLTDLRHYTRTISDRTYNGGEALAAHDQDFRNARENARRHLQMARHYWEKREWTGFNQELEYLAREYNTLNLVGWWSVGQMTRDSDDLVAQHFAFSAVGFRDNVSWATWRDKYVSKQRTNQNGLWEPASYDEWKRGGAGGGDLTRSPDFNGYGGDDPWTAPAPTVPTNPGTGDM